MCVDKANERTTNRDNGLEAVLRDDASRRVGVPGLSETVFSPTPWTDALLD